MGGNVFQWNEALIYSLPLYYGGLRGGAFDLGSGALLSSLRGNAFLPMDDRNDVGFRVASIPEPGTGVLAVLAGGLMWWGRKQFKF